MVTGLVTFNVRSVSSGRGRPYNHSDRTYLFSPLGKVAGRAIYFTDVFSLFFFYFFLMVDFLANVAETLIEQSSPKFQDS